MRMPFAATALAVTLLAPAAFAQGTGRSFLGRSKPKPATPVPAAAAAPAVPGYGAPARTDAQVKPVNSTLPDLVAPDELPKATIPLAADPIEPYLLTKDNGPFMVMAYTFRGPDSDRHAQTLAVELRRDHHLPAFVLRNKDFPMRSNIRGVPPTAPNYIRQPQVTVPEKYRTYDEASVLVGNCKTIDESEKVLKQVKKVRAACLDGLPSTFGVRTHKGLAGAFRTTNPFVPTQDLYPAKADPLIAQMNSGPHSFMKCPTRYSLQVAEFFGRDTVVVNGRGGNAGLNAKSEDDSRLRTSPLINAAKDAEKLAEALAKDPEVRRTGYEPYVLHDRSTSRVTVGSFQSPQDPNVEKCRARMLELIDGLTRRGLSDSVVIVPAGLIDKQTLRPVPASQASTR